MTQAANTLTLIAVAATMACGGRSNAIRPVPTLDPVGAVRQFMTAVERNDLTTMSALWGTKDGLAAQRLNTTQLEQRLTVMQRYLMHESYEVLDPEPVQLLSGQKGEEHLRIRLSRNNCTPVVPVTLVQLQGGWIVKAVDLSEAGNPQRAC